MRFLRHWPVIVGALVPLAALLEFAGNAYTSSRVPPFARFESARAVVEREHQPGDLVIVTPEWMGDGRVALGPWMPLADQARVDTLDHPRIWDLALEGREAPEVRGLPVEQRWEFDGLTLTRYRNSLYAPAVWRTLDRIGEAEVVVRAGDGEKPCRWTPHLNRHECGYQFGEPWVWVGPTVMADMDFLPRLCLWAHPTERGPIVVTFRDVPTAPRLVVHTGIAYIAARDGDKKPVRMDIELDGRPLGSVSQPDATGWRSGEFAVPDGPERRELRLLISTEFQGMRHFCFDVALRGRP